MSKIKKSILIIDSILIFGILISIFLLIGYAQPFAIKDLESENSNLLFTIPSNDYILIDDNSRFDSPQTVFINDIINLDSGRYFIKFFNGFSSEIRQIDLEREVNLEFKLVDNSIGVFNIGETDLLIETYDKGSLIDSSITYTGGLDE